jgi:hypothetical protein
MAVNRDVILQAQTWDRSDRTVLDMDSSESPVHGRQEGSAYSGHFETVCYTRCSCSMITATAWRRSCNPATSPAQTTGTSYWCRRLSANTAKASGFRSGLTQAFAKPEVYGALETRGVEYAIRIPAKKNLELEIEDILFRSPGRPSRKPLIRYKSFHYQADRWTKARRVVAKVEHHAGELLPQRRLHRDESPTPESCRRAVPQQARDRRTADQGRQAGRRTGHGCRVTGSWRTRSACS